MAWIARDLENNVLCVYEEKPIRKGISWMPDLDKLCIDMVKMPYNADEKLIGKHLTWENEPVEI